MITTFSIIEEVMVQSDIMALNVEIENLVIKFDPGKYMEYFQKSCSVQYQSALWCMVGHQVVFMQDYNQEVLSNNKWRGHVYYQ